MVAARPILVGPKRSRRQDSSIASLCKSHLIDGPKRRYYVESKSGMQIGRRQRALRNRVASSCLARDVILADGERHWKLLDFNVAGVNGHAK
jgi:hypothetical protein